MRADRLLALLALLQARGQLSSREIAAELEVSERTVHRDMEALAQAGIPVYANRGTKGGWMLPDGYRSRITGMTAEEIESLLLMHSSSVVNDLGLHRQAQAAFDKLLSALPEAVRRNAEYVRQRIHIDGAGWRGNARMLDPLLTVCQEAVWSDRKLRVAYSSRGGTASGQDGGAGKANGIAAGNGGNEDKASGTAGGYGGSEDKASGTAGGYGGSEDKASGTAGGYGGESGGRLTVSSTGDRFGWRLLSPLGLVAKTSIWYLIALNEDDQLRTFRVSRLVEAELTDERFVRPEPFDLAAYWERSTASFMSDLPRYAATVRIAIGSWERFGRERFVRVLDSKPAEVEAAWIEAEVEFNTEESACGILLSYGREVLALAPDELCVAVQREAEAITALYTERTGQSD